MQAAVDVIPTDKQLEWLNQADGIKQRTMSGDVQAVLGSLSDVQGLLELIQKVATLALNLRVPADWESIPDDPHRMGQVLEQWGYPLTFQPAVRTATDLAAHDPMRVTFEIDQEFPFLQKLGVVRPDAKPDAANSWWSGRSKEPPAKSADVEAAGPASEPTQATELPSAATLLAAPAEERAQSFGALVAHGSMRALRRRYLRFALRLVALLPGGLEEEDDDDEEELTAYSKVDGLLTSFDKLMKDYAAVPDFGIPEKKAVAAPTASSRRMTGSIANDPRIRSAITARQRSSASLVSTVQLSPLQVRRRYTGMLNHLTSVLETAALNSLFVNSLEKGLKTVGEYETVSNPLLSVVRGFAEEQIDNLEAAVRKAANLWEADPPMHPRDIGAQVFREHGSPDALATFLRTYKNIESWWDATTRANLPQPVSSGPRRETEPSSWVAGS